MRSYIEHLIDERGGKWIEEFEVEKTEREKEIIEFVKIAADRMLVELGRDTLPEIAESNIHILRENATDEYTEGESGVGAHAPRLGSVLVDRQESEVQFAITLFHELMHMKVYKALQLIQNDEGNDLSSYRSGFSVTDREGKKSYFNSLEEAVVGYLTKKFYDEVLTQDPLFSNEISSSEGTNEEEDTSRLEELAFLNKLVDDLWEGNKDRYETRDDVFKLFLDAHVHGRLLPIGRLIERTFGKGSFRQLGEATSILHE